MKGIILVLLFCFALSCTTTKLVEVPIEMLVNGIQKLGDIYSLSCRHDNSTYSITMNLDDNSYEISSISE